MSSAASLSVRRPIGAKLNRLVAVSVGVTLLGVLSLSAWSEADRYVLGKRETLLATARVFAAATSRAVATADAAAVRQSLRGIAQIPGIESGEVRNRDGNVIATLGSAVVLGSDLRIADEADGSLAATLRSGTLRASVPIREGGEEVGTLSLVTGTAGLAERIGELLGKAAIGAIGALALSLFLAVRLGRTITRPLTRLAGAMVEIERGSAVRSVLAEGAGDDETGYLARRFDGMMDEIRRATDALLAREEEIITRLSRAGEMRDDQTGQHVVRVAKISRLIADELGLDPAWTDDLCRASPMHDVGKISITDAILFKPGRLDPDERRAMEEHAEAGHAILAGSGAGLVQLAAEIALTHHERWDGQGYPKGLAGDAIPLSGRITAVADVCDALLSRRPYKEPWTLEAVRMHLRENAGHHFDPGCVAALLRAWPSLEAIYAPARQEAA